MTKVQMDNRLAALERATDPDVASMLWHMVMTAVGKRRHALLTDAHTVVAMVGHAMANPTTAQKLRELFAEVYAGQVEVPGRVPLALVPKP